MKQLRDLQKMARKINARRARAEEREKSRGARSDQEQFEILVGRIGLEKAISSKEGKRLLAAIQP